jgi:integrase
VSPPLARLLRHQTFRDRHGVTRETRTWYLPVGGNLKALGTTDLAEACRRAAAILGGVEDEGPKLSELLTMVENDYRANGYRSAGNLSARIRTIKAFFHDPLASEVTTSRCREYQAHRQKQGAANGTINVELAAVLRGFTLAKQDGKVSVVPSIPRLKVQNARKGFFEIAEAEAIIPHLPEHLRAFAWCCYYTGWRPKSELLTREWKHVDFGAGRLRLEPYETKNGDGREFLLYPDLRAVLEAQRARCDLLERRLGAVLRWVFFNDHGGRIRAYDEEWDAARKAAGLPNRIVYDFRRTAVRNLERADVPRSAAMAMVGHRTEAIYKRYAIVDEKMLREGANRLQKFHEGQREQPAKVRRLDTGK